ncbi:MAG: hypothetical protein A2297_04365 [Elusimicrobia bacterium RIFOXYB2_FULL_48_7]|nr:MAG: hypothetical protein A2297_04365 [Elusimicrobia bacterium RIFOXYB2_FULL_48_7]
MRDITPEMRKKIYEEEKAKRESTDFFSLSLLALANVLGIMFLLLVLKSARRKPKITAENLRKAHDGCFNYEEN